MITIVPYNPDWPREFDALAAPIRRAVGRLAWSVDHIGSTAVPGLAAKDIIDIQLTVSAFNPELETALVGLGYARRTDIIADHRPPGTTGLDSDWEKWYFQPPPRQRPTNLHVRIANRANQRYALLFRDYLRAHAGAADTYGLIKQRLAHYHPTDWDAYYDIKDPVCDIIWHAAQAWAAVTNWRPAS